MVEKVKTIILCSDLDEKGPEPLFYCLYRPLIIIVER